MTGPDTSIFGLPTEDEPDPDSPEEPEAPAAEETSETPEAEPTEPAEPEAETTDETPEAEPEAETEEQKAERLYAGRYKTDDELEKGYGELRVLQQRTAERAALAESQAQQLQQMLEQAAQLLPRQQAPEVDPEIARRAEAAGLDAEQLKVVQALAEQMADQRYQGVQAQFTQQQQQADLQRARAEEVAAAQAFAGAHPEAAADPNLVAAMDEVIGEFALEMSAPGVLDIAYEAAQNANLKRVLRANPAFIDTDEGMDLARQLASIQTKPVSPAAAAPRKLPHQETGPTGAAPATDTENKSDWDKALELSEQATKVSAFGV